MSYKADLEAHIRESYKLIQEYEKILRLSDAPKEKLRAKRDIDEQWTIIKGYLDEYILLCQRLQLNIADDLTEIVAHFPEYSNVKGSAVTYPVKGTSAEDVERVISTAMKTTRKPKVKTEGRSTMKVKVLFVAANPTSTDRLMLDEEIREITRKIEISKYRNLLEVESMWAARPDDLLQGLNQHRPHIVHFSGHGSSTGEIILVDNSGSPKAVSTQALKALFTTLKDNIRVVLLNACYSDIQAKAIVEVIDCVIGMNEAIGDQAAITFAASFYRAVGFGRSIKDAFDQGKTALLLEGIPEENTPELVVKAGNDPSQIVLTLP